MDIREELEWRPICHEFSRYYKVSRCGMVLSRRIKILKPWLSKCGRGYLNVSLSVKGRRSHQLVSRLVAAAWVPNPENKPHVNHINGDTTDNRADNLEWVSHAENMDHARRLGLMAIGPRGQKPLKSCHVPTHRCQWRYGNCPSCKDRERRLLLSQQRAKEIEKSAEK